MEYTLGLVGPWQNVAELEYLSNSFCWAALCPWALAFWWQGSALWLQRTCVGLHCSCQSQPKASLRVKVGGEAKTIDTQQFYYLGLHILVQDYCYSVRIVEFSFYTVKQLFALKTLSSIIALALWLVGKPHLHKIAEWWQMASILPNSAGERVYMSVFHKTLYSTHSC